MQAHPSSSIIVNRARALIAQHAHFRGRTDGFDFESVGDVLIIRGCVPTFYLKQLLQDALKQLPGVYRIDNRVDVFAYADESSLWPANSA